jgi:hypothetical protein
MLFVEIRGFKPIRDLIDSPRRGEVGTGVSITHVLLAE